MLGLVACVAALLASAQATVFVYTRLDHEIAEEFRDMPASFGGDVPTEGLRGLLVAGDKPDGCSKLAPPPQNVTNNYGKWIVLVARYNCSFEQKVRYAQDAGYDFVIVHNVNSSDLEAMSAKNATGIDIPSVFVSDLAGFLLGGEYQYDTGYYIMVNGDLPFNINTHLLLPFAIVVALCLVVILIFMIVKCINDRRRARRHRLPNRILKKIPTCKFSKVTPYETCAICLDDYEEGERLRVLPCAHAYHAKCIDPWLTQNKRVCPVCKRRVFAAGERRRRPQHSDSDTDDTEPLVSDAPAPITQGGTFEEQRENPFARAARFMARLRGRTASPSAEDAPDAEEAPTVEENDHMNAEDNTQEDDTQPLIQPSVRTEAERRPRRSRRTRARSSPRPAPLPATTAPLLHPVEHSINAEGQGEIGVAALPAIHSGSAPHHIAL